MDARGHTTARDGTVLVPVDEVAARLRCSRRTVFRLITAGEFASVKIGKQRHVAAADVDAYVRKALR